MIAYRATSLLSQWGICFYLRQDTRATWLVTSDSFTILIILHRSLALANHLLLLKYLYIHFLQIQLVDAVIKGYDVLSHTGTFQRPRKWQTEPDTCVPWRSSLNGRTRIQPSFPSTSHLGVALYCQHDSFLNPLRLRSQTSSNIAHRILQQDMSNKKKNISVTGTPFYSIRFRASPN